MAYMDLESLMDEVNAANKIIFANGSIIHMADVNDKYRDGTIACANCYQQFSSIDVLTRHVCNAENKLHGQYRTFDTGATRDTATGKFEYAGYLSPYFINEFARYMNKHQQMPDGTRRACDNWQKGMPLDVYVQSAFRHFFDFWSISRGIEVIDEKGKPVELSEAVMGLVFNLQGYWHEVAKEAQEETIKRSA